MGRNPAAFSFAKFCQQRAFSVSLQTAPGGTRVCCIHEWRNLEQSFSPRLDDAAFVRCADDGSGNFAAYSIAIYGSSAVIAELENAAGTGSTRREGSGGAKPQARSCGEQPRR